MFAVDQNVGNPGSTVMCILSQAGIRAKGSYDLDASHCSSHRFQISDQRSHQAVQFLRLSKRKTGKAQYAIWLA
jgi:hypothetical protein